MRTGNYRRRHRMRKSTDEDWEICLETQNIDKYKWGLGNMDANTDYRQVQMSTGKKKIDKSIDFLRGWEKKMVSIFRLRRCAEVGVS